MTAWIDANIILRLLLDDISEQHRRARALLQSERPVRVSATAITEAIFVLGRGYGLSREQQATAIRGLLALPEIIGPDHIVSSALDTYVGHPKLSFEDCLLVAEAEAAGGTLWTFDRKLSNQTSAASVPVEEIEP